MVKIDFYVHSFCGSLVVWYIPAEYKSGGHHTNITGFLSGFVMGMSSLAVSADNVCTMSPLHKYKRLKYYIYYVSSLMNLQ
jgi:hypothetical protein